MFKTFAIVGLNLKKLILESFDARNCSCNSSKSPDFSSRSSTAIDSKKELECSFGMENPLPSESLINDLEISNSTTNSSTLQPKVVVADSDGVKVLQDDQDAKRPTSARLYSV